MSRDALSQAPLAANLWPRLTYTRLTPINK
jgi:hypothetical protein